LGHLVGGFAHEIKNPLSTIGLQLELLKEEWAEHDGAREQRACKKIDLLQREVRRLQGILEEFLRYVREPQLELAATDVNTILQEVLDFVEPELIRQGTVIRFHPDPGLPELALDVNQFRQAILNLLINAKQAVAEGGEVIVETRGSAAGVRIAITDTGDGMSPDVLARCFQPYFSTKKGGTGLGLPTTKRILEDHGGSIEVQSEPGRGTRFVIDLPLPGAGPVPPGSPGSAGAHEKPGSPAAPDPGGASG
jgi:signal transduction histidine kinase